MKKFLLPIVLGMLATYNVCALYFATHTYKDEAKNFMILYQEKLKSSKARSELKKYIKLRARRLVTMYSGETPYEPVDNDSFAYGVKMGLFEIVSLYKDWLTLRINDAFIDEAVQEGRNRTYVKAHLEEYKQEKHGEEGAIRKQADEEFEYHHCISDILPKGCSIL